VADGIALILIEEEYGTGIRDYALGTLMFSKDPSPDKDDSVAIGGLFWSKSAVARNAGPVT